MRHYRHFRDKLLQHFDVLRPTSISKVASIHQNYTFCDTKVCSSSTAISHWSFPPLSRSTAKNIPFDHVQNNSNIFPWLTTKLICISVPNLPGNHLGICFHFHTPGAWKLALFSSYLWLTAIITWIMDVRITEVGVSVSLLNYTHERSCPIS